MSIPHHPIFNLQFDPYSERDFLHLAKPGVSIQPIELADKCPHRYDQGELGSCTGNMGAMLHRFNVGCQMDSMDWSTIIDPARLFLYWCSRPWWAKGYDSGSTIRDTLKAQAKYGICHDALYPYDVSQFANRPTMNAFADGLDNQTVQYARVSQTMEGILSALNEIHLVGYGFVVYESFMRDEVRRTGKVPMPNLKSERPLGGHANALCGYNTAPGHFTSVNSYGEDFGDRGFLYLPEDYVLNKKLASDFWINRLVEVNNVAKP